MDSKGLDTKVAELVAVTQRLDVTRILMVRRMTLIDPATLKWANTRQLELIFNVILEKALERTGAETVLEASKQQFDTILPPGPDDTVDQERWMLFDLSRAMLAGLTPNVESTAEAVMTELALDETPLVAGNFAELFDETLVRHTRRALAALSTTHVRPHHPHPFIIAPSFAACYEQVLREFVLPTMRGTRRIKELAGTRNWTEAGGSDRLIGMTQSADTNNPILHHWDARWAAFHPEQATAKGKGKIRSEDHPWTIFEEDAAKHGYMAPRPSDIPMLQRILRLEGDVITHAWQQLAQIYEQEYQPKNRSDQARAGAFRDAVIRAFDKLDQHMADMLTIRCFFEFPKVVDRLFVKQLFQTLGRSDAERNRKAPVLIGFYNDLPK